MYRGNVLSSLQFVASDDDGNDDQTSALYFSANIGMEYQIVVDTASDETGAIHLGLTLAPGPANDDFVNARTLNGTADTSRGTNLRATKEPGEPAHAGNAGGESVWFKWTAPISGIATVSTVGSDFDTVLGVYKGTSVSSLTEVGSNDDAGDANQACCLGKRA